MKGRPSDRLPGHVRLNRAAWDSFARDYAEPGRADWARQEPVWGIWHIPEAQLHVLPNDLDGLDAIELGCGTAYVSAWLARRGARPVGIDISAEQLSTARRLQGEFGLDFPLVSASAESVPYPDASFDIAISEYGASIWADPYHWIPEASRLLRPGGRLIFFTGAPLLMLCVPDLEAEGPAGERLLRPYFGMHRFDWPDEPRTVEFHLPHGELIGLMRANELEVEELVEVQAPPDAQADPRWGFVTPDWARRWPSEEIWKARKRGGTGDGHKEGLGG